jgi:hypothetical protein
MKNIEIIMRSKNSRKEVRESHEKGDVSYRGDNPHNIGFVWYGIRGRGRRISESAGIFAAQPVFKCNANCQCDTSVCI